MLSFPSAERALSIWQIGSEKMYSYLNKLSANINIFFLIIPKYQTAMIYCLYSKTVGIEITNCKMAAFGNYKKMVSKGFNVINVTSILNWKKIILNLKNQMILLA